jgi:signal recognition particle receptor subunit beta
LRDFSIAELIQSCLLDKKSVACKIMDNEWSAKLRLHQGKLESASCSGSEGTKAVLEIMHHQRGEIFLNYFSDSKPAEPLEASTPVHLLELQYQQKLLKEFLQKCGENNPIFKKAKMADADHFSEAEKIILKILEQRLSLKKLLKISSLSFLHTFRIIENFLQKGIIEIEKESQESQQFSEEDLEFFYEKLFNPGQKIGQILILGSSETVKHQGIETIAKSIESQLVTNNLAEITAVTLDQQAKLYFVALPLNDQIHRLLESFVSDLVATVFIIDLAQQTEMDYPKYFLRQFLAEYSLPFVIGITNVGENTEEAIQKVKNKLEIPSHVHLSVIDPQNFPQFRRLLLKLLDNTKT